MRQRSGLLNRAWLAVIGLVVLLAGMVAALIALGLLARITTAIGIGLLASLVYTHLLSDGGRINGQQGLIMNVVILAGALVFLGYAQWMAKRGVLR